MAAGLTSCSTTSAPTGVVFRSGRDWAFIAASKSEPAKLAYGIEDTDDVELMLVCEPAAHAVQVVPVGVESGGVDHVQLESGGQSQSLDIHQDARFGSAGRIPLDAPVLKAFQSSVRIRLVLPSKRQLDLPVNARRGHDSVRDFFAACK